MSASAEKSVVVLFICGHGELSIDYDGNTEITEQTVLTDKDIKHINPVMENSSAKLDMITFAAPGEPCYYIPADFPDLIKQLTRVFAPDVINNYITKNGQIKFKTAVNHAQLSGVGYKYTSIYRERSNIPNYVENHYIGHKYPDKCIQFHQTKRNAHGVHLIYTNDENIPVMDYREYLQEAILQDPDRINNNYLYLSDIIEYFERMGVDQICILDSTCSGIPEEYMVGHEKIKKR